MSDLRVCFVEAYPCFRGAQRSLAALAGSLGPSASVRVICTVEGPCVSGFAEAGLDPHLVEVPPSLRRFGGALTRQGPLGTVRTIVLGLLPYIVRLARQFLRERPHVVHCNQARGVLLAAPAARLLGIPVLWHLRGRNTFGGLVERALYRLADRIVCVSQAVEDSLGPAGRAKSCVVPNGISAHLLPSAAAVAALRERIAEEKARRGLRPDALTLVTASSLVPYKGLHHLVEALRILTRERPDLRQRLLWIALGDAGDEAQHRYRAELDRRIAAADLAGSIWWPGWQERAMEWLAASDLTVLPTVDRECFEYGDGSAEQVHCSEGFPRTILESMVVGTPVLASAVAGVAEQIVDGESGFVIQPGSARELADRVGWLVDRPDLRTAAATAAQQRVRRFSVEAMRDGVLDYYKSFLEGGVA